MEKLQDLSQAELQDLLDNPERVEAMALESDEIQNIQLEREMALASNRSLAEQNLDTKPQLEREKARLVEKYHQLEGVRDRYRQHCTLKDGIMGQSSPEGLLSRLQVEGANTEAESEVLADEFLEGSLALDSFLERFHSLRCLAHRRRVGVEKLQEILRRGSQATSDPAEAAPPVAADGVPASPWQHQHAPRPPPPQPEPAVPANTPGAAPPYPSYPTPPLIGRPRPPDAAAPPPNPAGAFQPYCGQAAAFPAASGYPAVRPGFVPSCPYPSRPAFPSPQGPPFGQFGPPNAPYPYSGYGFPVGPSQSPTSRPIYRPGFGVPQPYS